MLELAYISSKEAAHLLGKTPRRINQLVKEGALEAKVIGNSNVIAKASVLQLRRSQRARRIRSSDTNSHK